MPSLRFVWGFLLLTAVMSPLPALSDVLIFTPEVNYARDVAEKLKSHIKPPSRIVHTLDVNSSTDVVVALGRESFLHASANTSVPVVGAFLSIVDQAPSPSKTVRYRILSDPSPQKMADFLEKKFPNSVVGFIHTDEEALFVHEMHQALQGSSTRLESIIFSGNTFSDIRHLDRKGIDLMLISKNRDIYHSGRIRFVLEALFRKKVPVVSMSAALIPAGATVSVSPSVEAVVQVTSSYANSLVDGRFPAPQRAVYVDDVVIDVNSAMAEYFNFDFGGETR